MMKPKRLCLDIVKDRYGKPVLTPIRGVEVAKTECFVQRSMMTAAKGPIPWNGTIPKTNWPKEVDNNRYEKPVRSPYWGTNMTIPDHVTIKQKSGMTAAKCQIPLNGVAIDRLWPKGINSNRNEKPIRTPSLRTEVGTTDCVDVEQRMKTIKAEGCINRADKVEPSRGQETTVAAMGVRTGGTNDRGSRCTDCSNKTMTAGTLQTKCGDLRKPISGMVPPFVTKMAPTDGTGMMHYQWIVRESVRTTNMLMPSNYLEIPEVRLPRIFLYLAEEARNVEVKDELSCCSEEAQRQRTGLPSPILVTVMVDRQPIPIKNVLANTDTSAEMMTNVKYVGQCNPIDRADQVASPDMTEQPIWLGLNTEARRNASADTGGPDVKSVEQRKPVGPQNTTERPVWLGPKMNENEKAPVDPVGQDVNLTEQDEPVDRSGPVGPQSTTEQSALFGLMRDGTKNPAVCPGGPDMNSAG